MGTHKSESRPGEKVLFVAQQLHKLDSFFAIFSRNPQIKVFLEENRPAVYGELSYRLLNGSKKELFGSFEPLLESAQNYLLEFQAGLDSSPDVSEAGGLRKIARKLKKMNQYRRGIKTILAVAKEHGTEWIPTEFKRTLNFSLLALPVMFVMYESMRVSVIATLAGSNIEEFTNFILGLYVVVAVLGFIQEQKTLQHADAIVFNPYSNLFALGLSPLLSGVASRTPRHAFELSAIMSAIAAQKEVSIPVLAPVLAAVIAAMTWSSADIIFNFTQQKIQESKKSNSVYNLA